MSQNENDKPLNHNYDEIQEYDNQMPTWWVQMFLISIVFAIIYFFFYHVTDLGKGLVGTYEDNYKKVALDNSLKAKEKKSLSEDELKAVAQKPESIAAGKAIYDTRCSSCHGAHGEGLVGPNLTDDYWIHGGKYSDLIKVVTEGVPAKGMVPWGGILKEEEIIQVVGFIKSLKGKKVSGGKGPEGDFYGE